jgi:hypothetical protein
MVLACVALTVNDANNVLMVDSSDFAQIILTAELKHLVQFCKDQLYTYPAGTFTGFRIENLNNLLQADLYESLTVSTFNDGVLQESISGDH